MQVRWLQRCLVATGTIPSAFELLGSRQWPNTDTPTLPACQFDPIRGMCSNIIHFNPAEIQKLKLLWVHRGMAAACKAVPLVQDGGGAWGIGNLSPAASKNRCVVRLATFDHVDHVDLCWNRLIYFFFKGTFDGGKCLNSPYIIIDHPSPFSSEFCLLCTRHAWLCSLGAFARVHQDSWNNMMSLEPWSLVCAICAIGAKLLVKHP